MEKLLSELETVKQLDANFTNILGSMCTIPHEISKKAYDMFIETNLGDYNLFKGTKQLEQRTIQWIAHLMHAPAGYGGLLTSGGTESNITSLWIFKILSGNNEVIVPKQAHFSFNKAASLLNLKLNTVECKYHMKSSDLQKHIMGGTRKSQKHTHRLPPERRKAGLARRYCQRVQGRELRFQRRPILLQMA